MGESRLPWQPIITRNDLNDKSRLPLYLDIRLRLRQPIDASSTSPDGSTKNMVRTVIAVIDDMFLASKVRATAKALGMLAVFPRSLDALRHIVDDSVADIVVVDLQHAKLDALAVGAELKTNAKLSGISVIGFFAHVEAELQRKAVQAGYDQVMPRSVFFGELANILSGDSKKA
jgi:CheY-like chemotaxis protein